MSDLTRPIIGIENREPQEVFDIMCDRLRAALATAEKERDAAREELSTWRSVFPDIAPSSVVPNVETIARQAYNDALERAVGLRDNIADLIGAAPMSSIHSALCEYAKAISALKKETSNADK